jgi:glycosyl transferase family 25
VKGLGLSDIYVVHARFLADRQRHIEEQMRKAGLSFTWVTAYDPDDIDEPTEGRWFAPGHGLSKAQMSCSLKHVAALQAVAAADAPFALVVEDDAILVNGFAGRLAAVAAEFAGIGGVAYIGAGDNWFVGRDRLLPGRLLYPETRSRTTDAYLVTRQAARARLAWIAAEKMGKPIGHVFNDCDPACGIAITWAEPPLVTQGSFNGRFQSAIMRKRPRWAQGILFAYKRVVRRLRR